MYTTIINPNRNKLNTLKQKVYGAQYNTTILYAVIFCPTKSDFSVTTASDNNTWLWADNC